MSKHTIISDISQRLVESLQNYLVPRVMRNKSAIGLCSPEQKEDYSIGIFLYHIKEAEEIHRVRRVNVGINSQMRPPLYLTLYYMITAYSTSDTKFRMIEEEKLLGGIFQFCIDHPIMSKEQLYDGKTIGLDAHINLLRIETDERSKIWSFKDISYQPSVFIAVTPILLESEDCVSIVRVKEAEFNISSLNDNL